MFGAISTVLSLFDRNARAKFDSLAYLKEVDHPLPSIRLFYAEEIAHGQLSRLWGDCSSIWKLETEWQKIVCDVDSDFDGQVDMGQVFYYPAYTRKAQEHLSVLKRRLIDIYDTLQPLSLSNFPEKLAEEDLEVLDGAIWFDEKGNSLYGWN